MLEFDSGWMYKVYEDMEEFLNDGFSEIDDNKVLKATMFLEKKSNLSLHTDVKNIYKNLVTTWKLSVDD